MHKIINISVIASMMIHLSFVRPSLAGLFSHGSPVWSVDVTMKNILNEWNITIEYYKILICKIKLWDLIWVL